MARLAIYIDGGYIAKLGASFRTWIDFEKLSARIHQGIAADTPEPLDVVRTYFYDCLPYQHDPPTREEAERFGQRRRFFAALRKLPKFASREGRLMYRGDDADGNPIFQQKRVDLMIGLDFALLAAKHQITHAAVLTGIAICCPPLKWPSRNGWSSVWCTGPVPHMPATFGSWPTTGFSLTATS